MDTLTWGEFKRQVEAVGVKDDDEIEYIDVASYPTRVHASRFSEVDDGIRNGSPDKYLFRVTGS